VVFWKTISVTLLALLSVMTTFESQSAIPDIDSSWPSLRRDSRNTGFSESTVPNAPQTAWTSDDIPSFAPIIADGRVFSTGGKGTNLTVMDERDGRIVWTKDVPTFRSSPTVANGIIYVGTLNGEIWALNGSSGENVWKYNIYGYGEPLGTPQVADDRVFFNNRDGWLFCANATNGDFLWKYETRLAEVARLAVADGRVFTMYSCLNDTDGTLLWEYENKPVGIGYYRSTPTVDDGRVFLSIGPSLHAVDEFNGSLRWKFDTEQGTSDVAVAYDSVFVSSSGCLYSLNETNGHVNWSFNTTALVENSPSVPSVADGKVLVIAGSHCFCLNATDGSLVWRFSPAPFSRPPSLAIADGMVFLSGSEGIYAQEIYAIRDYVPESPITLTLTIALLLVAITATIVVLYRRRLKSHTR
jgi:outer membrane protein assembly factor BamB